MARLAIDEGELLRCCRLPDDNCFRDNYEIPLHSFVSALEFAADAGRCRHFGWQAGQHYNLCYLGDLGEAVANAPTLGSALQVFDRYLRLIQSSSEITFDIEGDQLVLSYRILDPDVWPRQQDAEFTMSLLCSIVCRCAGVDWQPLYCCFEHQPTGETSGRNHELGITCDYDCDANTIVLPIRMLDTPMPKQDAADWHAVFAQLNDALNEHERAQPVSARVETTILSTLGRDPPSQSTIADQLGLSPRSLHRRLKAEGTSYGAILSDCRSRLSRFLLLNGDHPLSQVAHDLGYSDYTAFSRAFRASFGHTPKDFRDHNRTLAGSQIARS